MLHGVLNKSIKKQLKQFVNMDEKDLEIDRLIRMNRMSKNKNVAIKLGKMLEVFEMNQNHNEIIGGLGIVEVDGDWEEDDNDANIVKSRAESPVKIKKIAKVA